MKTYTEHGVEHRVEEVPDGHVVIDTYNPHSTPWDYHGGKHLREMAAVLKNAGLSPVSLVEHHRRVTPHGTGPGGRVRFGDDMMPGIYRTAVPVDQEVAAKAALEAHKSAIAAWLDGSGEMPAVLRN